MLPLLQVKSRRLKQLHWDKIKTPQQGTVWAKDQPQVNLNLTELENLFQVSLHTHQQHMSCRTNHLVPDLCSPGLCDTCCLYLGSGSAHTVHRAMQSFLTVLYSHAACLT